MCHKLRICFLLKASYLPLSASTAAFLPEFPPNRTSCTLSSYPWRWEWLNLMAVIQALNRLITNVKEEKAQCGIIVPIWFFVMVGKICPSLIDCATRLWRAVDVPVELGKIYLRFLVANKVWNKVTLSCENLSSWSQHLKFFPTLKFSFSFFSVLRLSFAFLFTPRQPFHNKNFASDYNMRYGKSTLSRQEMAIPPNVFLTWKKELLMKTQQPFGGGWKTFLGSSNFWKTKRKPKIEETRPKMARLILNFRRVLSENRCAFRILIECLCWC